MSESTPRWQPTPVDDEARRHLDPPQTLTFSTDETVGLPEGVHETVLIDGDQRIPVTITVHPDGTHEIRGRADHEHDWVDTSYLSDADRRELCTICKVERLVPR